MEKRLDDHRRSVGLMSFWPTGGTTNVEESDPANSANTANTESIVATNPSTANNFAFDDFFRKSAVLGPTSSPLINPATRNNNVGPSGYLSSPLGTKVVNNVPVNKEISNVNDYNLI